MPRRELIYTRPFEASVMQLQARDWHKYRSFDVRQQGTSVVDVGRMETEGSTAMRDTATAAQVTHERPSKYRTVRFASCHVAGQTRQWQWHQPRHDLGLPRSLVVWLTPRT